MHRFSLICKWRENLKIYLSRITRVIRVISGPEYGWAMKIGQWSMSHSFASRNQDFDGPFEILMGHLEKKLGTRNLNIHLTAK